MAHRSTYRSVLNTHTYRLTSTDVSHLALPHCSTEDDVESGYFIPKGSLVYANIWYVIRRSIPPETQPHGHIIDRKMLHDPAVYDQPFEFKPERFIRTDAKEPELDPYKMTFGFGRR